MTAARAYGQARTCGLGEGENEMTIGWRLAEEAGVTLEWVEGR
jgi:hypothetical protein